MYDPLGIEKTSKSYDPLGIEKSWGVEDTLRSAGAVLGGFAAMPVAGVAGLAKLVTSGSLNEATKTMEGVSSIPSKLLETEQQKETSQKVGEVLSYPFAKAGEGWRLIGEATGIPYAEPVLGTLGETAALIGIGGLKGAVKGRLKGKIEQKYDPLNIVKEEVKSEYDPLKIVETKESSLEPTKKTAEQVPVIDGKESRLAIRTEERAIADKLTEDFGDLPQYKTMSMDEQAVMAKKVLDTDYEQAKRMAMGDEPTPKELREASVYEAVKIRALAEGDVDTLQKLATESSIPARLSEYGQAIKAADSRIMEDPVKVMQDVTKTRVETSKRTGVTKATQAVIEKLNTKVADLEKAIADHESVKVIERIKNDIDKEQRQTKRVYAKEELSVEFDGLVGELNKLLGSQLNVGLDPTAVVVVGKMARNLVQRGVITVEGIVDTIYTAAKNAGLELDPREIRDAISGYGKTIELSKDATKMQLRELKRQMRLISALEDAKVGEVPLRTGLQRDTMSDRVRELTKKVKEAMRESGIDTVKTPEEQWKTLLQTYKTRVGNGIKDMQRNLSTGNFIKKERQPLILDPEAKRLKNEYDRYNEAYKLAVKSAGKVTKEEATNIVEMSKIVAEKKIALEQGGDRFEYGAAKVAFENYVNSLKGNYSPIKTQVKERIAEFKTTAKDNKARAVYELSRDLLKQITDNSIAMVATLDNSFLGRQGLKTLMTHPTKWYPAAKESFKDFAKTLGGKDAHDALMADIYSRPNHLNGEYKTAKIISHMEEQYPSTLPEQIPGLGRVFKASEYAFTGSALRMRTDLYDMLSKQAKENGVSLGKKEIESIGKLINSLTAKGQWGKKGEPAIVKMILWAPKMLKANLDVLTAHNLGAGLESTFARKQAAMNLVKIVGETAAIMMLANALKPGSAEYDPRSSNFGKIKVNNRTYDITGGAASIVTLAARIATKSSKNSVTGAVTKYGIGYGKKSPFDAIIDFLVNKTSPPARVVVDWLRGQSFGFKKFTWGGAAYQAITPIALQNVINLKDDNSADAVVGIIADGLGISSTKLGKR